MKKHLEIIQQYVSNGSRKGRLSNSQSSLKLILYDTLCDWRKVCGDWFATSLD